MAKVLKEHNFARRLSLYPWDKWLDGQTWQLTQGKDFKCSVLSFQSTAQATANKRGGRLRTHTKDKKLVIQFYREPKR